VDHDATATFRLPRRWQVGLFTIAIAGPCASLLIDFHFGMLLSPVPDLITIAVAALVWVFLVPLYTVQLRPDGVRLFNLWWLPWTQVREARYRKVFGFPYFLVKRRRGFSWWIPLYFVGDCDLGQAIIRAAPPGNPFRLVSIPR
jgi:hypothetical protein